MILEAVWFKDGKEVVWVDPVIDVVSYEDIENINEIEVYNGHYWYSIEDFDVKADDFVIRIKKD